jgi:hypothetical protein
MEGPLSSYSCFEIHICWKVEREARIDPPIQTAIKIISPYLTILTSGDKTYNTSSPEEQ